MGIPTIGSLSPVAGPSLGRSLVVITGTNFRTRALVYGIPAATVGSSTVRVTFNGRACPYAWAESSTRLLVLTPQYLGAARSAAFAAVDVAVQNLDDAGAPIAGESVTKLAAYTYERPLLGLPAPDPPGLQVLYAFLDGVARVATPEVCIAAHPDYGASGQSFIDVVRLPGIGISVALPRDKEYGQWDNVRLLKWIGPHYELWGSPRTHMLVADLTAVSEHDGVAYRLIDALVDWAETQPELIVPGDTRWSSAENAYPIEISRDPEHVGVPNGSGLESWTIQMRVRGIPFIPTYPIGNIYTISQLFLAMGTIAGGVAYPKEVV